MKKVIKKKNLFLNFKKKEKKRGNKKLKYCTLLIYIAMELYFKNYISDEQLLEIRNSSIIFIFNFKEENNF